MLFPRRKYSHIWIASYHFPFTQFALSKISDSVLASITIEDITLHMKSYLWDETLDDCLKIFRKVNILFIKNEDHGWSIVCGQKRKTEWIQETVLK